VLSARLRPLLHLRFTGLKRDLERYVDDYNFERVHDGRLKRGRIAAQSSTVRGK
jgi:hypothetical protein